MIDVLDAGMKFWEVSFKRILICRVFAIDDFVVVRYGAAEKDSILNGKADVDAFVQRTMESQSPGADEIVKAVNAASDFITDASAAFHALRHGNPKAENKDEMRDWLKSFMRMEYGSMVQVKDLHKAWHQHFEREHGTLIPWETKHFKDRLQQLGYRVKVTSGYAGRKSYVIDMIVRDGRDFFFHQPKRKRVKRNPATTTPPPTRETTP